MAEPKAEVPSVEAESEGSFTIAEHSELLEAFYQIPSIEKAWLFPSKSGKDFEAMLIMSEVNLMANSKRRYQSFVNIPKGITDKPSCNWSVFPAQLTGVSLVVPSKSGDKLLIIRNGESGGKDKPNPTKFEVWSSAHLLKEIVIPASVHGPVYTDGWFEGVSWSPDESHIAYVAEDPIPSRPIYGNTVKTSDMKLNESDLYTWKGQGDWQEDWGEAYTGKQKPSVFVADLKDGYVQKVTGVPDDLNVGQVTWAPSHGLEERQFLVFVGWPSVSESFQTDRKLGIKYCFNRPCALYAIEVLQKEGSSSASCLQKLPISLKSAFLPRFSPKGDLLIFLSAHEAVKTGVHNSTNSLHSIKWPIDKENDFDSSLKEVVSIKQPKGSFPGLYCESLIGSPWLLDNETIVLSSLWFSSEAIIAINTSSGKWLRISPEHDRSSWNLLSIHDDFILAVKSNFGKPPSLQLGVPSSLSDSSRTWAWFDISNNALQFPPKVEATLKSVTYEFFQIPASNAEDPERGAQSYESIFVSSTSITTEHEQKKRPLVVVIHGGPHSAYTTSFSKSIGYLVGLGLNLLLVNYRGSLGYGEEALQSLPGKAGQQDVEDVLRSVDYVISKGLVDPKKVAITGGSHGGFLSTHLIGQAPDRFVTAAVRNPVCNISSMVGISDIPDWCYVETYGQTCFENYTDAPTPDHLEKFYKASPISHIENVKVPTLFILGAQDRRVPIANGFQYVHALKARGLKVKIIVFPEDAHPIDRPQSEFESWISIGTWLLKHLA